MCINKIETAHLDFLYVKFTVCCNIGLLALFLVTDVDDVYINIVLRCNIKSIEI